MNPEIFICKKCGHCCEGRGGIVLSDNDLARLAKFLGVDEDFAAREYAEISNGKLKIKTGTDGYCLFFEQGKGCSVHEGKPDICKAWPFFRGNLEDRISLELAKDFCPGIDKSVNFEEFAIKGLAYLQDNNLLSQENSKSANSLFAAHIIKVFQEK